MDNMIELAPLAPLDGPTELMATDASNDMDVFVPEKVCAKMIQFSVEDHKLAHLNFTGGCEGNLTAIAKLVEGMDIDDVVNKLEGIKCGNKPTSCTDQLCIALREHMGEEA